MGRAYRLALRVASLRYLPLCLGLSALITGGLALNGCSSTGSDPFAGRASPMYQGSGPLPKGGGRYVVGNPYEVGGRRYYPSEDPGYDKVGVASWYGPKFHRRMTSNGEWFDQDYLSAAHPTLPLPSYARVTNLENGRNLVVRVNDRGPFVADRIIDLSKKSADVLDVRRKGTAKVRVQYLGPAPLNDQGTHLASMNNGLDSGAVMVADASAPEPAAPSRPPMQQLEPPEVEAAVLTTDLDQSQDLGENTYEDTYQDDSRDIDLASGPYFGSDGPDSGQDFGQYARQDSGQDPGQDGGFYIQVGSFSDPSNAGRAEANLASLFRVETTPVDVERGRFYRVRVGPLQDQASAQVALSRIQAAGHHDARVVVAQN